MARRCSPSSQLVLGCLLLLLTGCTNPLTRFLPSTELGADGRLTIYTPLPEGQANTYLRLFQGANPRLNVNLVVLTPGEILNRLLAEKTDPQADVVWGVSATLMSLLEWQDVLLAYAPAGRERVFLEFQSTSNPPYWVGFGAWMSAFCVNPERLAALGLPKPDSWQSLFDPVYRGQIAMPRPDLSGTGYMIVEAIVELFGEVNGWENLDALDRNIKTYTTSAEEACNLAAQGEVAIGISNDISPINLAAAGKPVEAVFAAEGTAWDIEANGLIDKETINDAAKTFLDWAISEQMIEIYGESRILVSTPVENQIPPPGIPENPRALLYDKDFPWASANRDLIIGEWLARYGEKTTPE